MTQQLPFPMTDIDQIEFFKRDELTIDLICCQIFVKGSSWVYHEEIPEWDKLIAQLSTLPHFDTGWFGQISQPAFASSEFIAFKRNNA